MTAAALCPECDQPMLPKGRRRKHESDYRHASGCPRGESVVEHEAEPRKKRPCGHTRETHLRMLQGLEAGACDWVPGEVTAEPAGGQEKQHPCHDPWCERRP